VRADECALVALDTFFGIPFRNIDSDSAFLKSSCACGDGSVGMFTGEGTDRNIVAVLSVDNIGYAAYPLGCETVEVGRTETGHYVVPLGGYCQLLVFGSTVNSRIVHADHFLSFLAIALVYGFFHEGNSLLVRDDAGNLEEC